MFIPSLPIYLSINLSIYLYPSIIIYLDTYNQVPMITISIYLSAKYLSKIDIHLS